MVSLPINTEPSASQTAAISEDAARRLLDAHGVRRGARAAAEAAVGAAQAAEAEFQQLLALVAGLAGLDVPTDQIDVAFKERLLVVRPEPAPPDEGQERRKGVGC